MGTGNARVLLSTAVPQRGFHAYRMAALLEPFRDVSGKILTAENDDYKVSQTQRHGLKS